MNHERLRHCAGHDFEESRFCEVAMCRAELVFLSSCKAGVGHAYFDGEVHVAALDDLVEPRLRKATAKARLVAGQNDGGRWGTKLFVMFRVAGVGISNHEFNPIIREP